MGSTLALRESVGTVGRGPCCGCIWCVTFGDDAGCPGCGSPERPWGLRDELTVWVALCSADKKVTAAVGRRKRVSRVSRDSGPHWPRGAGGAGGRWAPRPPELGSGPLASGTLLLSAPQVGPPAGLPCVGSGVTVRALPTPLWRRFAPNSPLLHISDTSSGCRCGAGARGSPAPNTGTAATVRGQRGGRIPQTALLTPALRRGSWGLVPARGLCGPGPRAACL